MLLLRPVNRALLRAGGLGTSAKSLCAVARTRLRVFPLTTDSQSIAEKPIRRPSFATHACRLGNIMREVINLVIS